MREIKFKFLMENGEITSPYYLKELIDSDSYINIECEYSSKIKQELQYTDLKDKNGVEIYEGDIVYLSGIGLTEIEFPFIDLYQACYENDIGAIIGNTYENPELLKEGI